MEDDEKSIVNENETKKNDGCLKKLGKLFKKSTKEQVTPVKNETRKIKTRTKRNESALFSFLKEKLNVEKNVDLVLKDYEDQSKIMQEIDNYLRLGSNIIEYKNEYDDTILHEACKIKESKKITNPFEIFCKLANAYKSGYMMQNKYGQTVLHLASYFNNLEIIKHVIENTGNKSSTLIDSMTHEERQTALHYAVKQGNTEIVKYLLNCGANIEIPDYIQRTPLFLASEHGESEVAELLIKKGAIVEVSNSFGQLCLYWIIAKCPDLAEDILNKYKKYDIYTKRDTYNLKYVELNPKSIDIKITEKNSQPKSILSLIVETGNLDLIVHPVIVRLVKYKWKEFGRVKCFIDLIFTIMNIVVWNLIGVLGKYNERHYYKLPDDGWRIFLLVFGILGMLILILIEVMELVNNSKYNERVKKHRHKELEGYGKYRMNQPDQIGFWKEERAKLAQSKLFYSFIVDFWNWFDIISILILITVVITHLIDIYHHSEYIARIHISILAIAVVIISLRLLKVGRVLNQEFGMLVMTLYFVINDITVWVITYAAFLIPFSSAFYILFGGIQSTFINSKNQTVTISGLSSYNSTLFRLYRISFGVDLDRDNMNQADNVLTDPLIGAYLGLTVLIDISIFIAMLTGTFNRVQDKSRAYFIMQRAIEVLKIEHSMKSIFSINWDYRKHLENLQTCDEDKKQKTNNLTTDMDELKKDLINETIKTIKEKSNELDEKIRSLTEQLDNKENNNSVEKVIPSKNEPDVSKVRREFDSLKFLILKLINEKTKSESASNILVRNIPRVDVLHTNEINENQVELSAYEFENLKPIQ